jgi:hypothetical protein
MKIYKSNNHSQIDLKIYENFTIIEIQLTTLPKISLFTKIEADRDE